MNQGSSGGKTGLSNRLKCSRDELLKKKRKKLQVKRDLKDGNCLIKRVMRMHMWVIETAQKYKPAQCHIRGGDTRKASGNRQKITSRSEFRQLRHPPHKH